MVSLWAASHEGVLRWLLPALAIVAILPRLGGGNWDAPYAVPPFFTDAGYRTCLERGENVLPLPANSNGDSDLWQVSSGFRFRMAGGYVSAGPPPGFLTPKAVSWIAQGGAVPVDQVQKLRTYIEEKARDERRRRQDADALLVGGVEPDRDAATSSAAGSSTASSGLTAPALRSSVPACARRVVSASPPLPPTSWARRGGGT